MKQSTVFLFFLIAALPCQAQWRSMGFGLQVLAFGVHDTSFFVSDVPTLAQDPLVYRLVLPKDWIADTAGIDRSQGRISSFASLGRFFFASMAPPDQSGIGGIIYTSTDNGTTWLDKIHDAGGPIASNNVDLFANASEDSAARSTDSSVTWYAIPCPVTRAYATTGACIIASTSKGIYRSIDNGKAWSSVTAPISSVTSFAVVRTMIYASNGTPGQSGGQLIQSTDSGATWTLVNTGFPVSVLASDSVHLFAGGPTGVYYFDSKTGTWRNENGDSANLKGRGVVALGVFDTLLFADFASGPHLNFELYSRSIPEMTDSTTSAVAAAAPKADTLDIYPNPARDVVTILSGGTSIERVIVMNLLGEKVLDVENVRVPQIRMDISKLPAGTYYLRIEMGSGEVVMRRTVKE